MAKQRWLGGLLIVLSLVLLPVSGRLGLWIVLLPISILLAYGMSASGRSGKIS
jgi:hypothetical protein